MRIHRDQLGLRVGGTLTGAGFVAIGLYALLGGDGTIGEVARERADGFGLAAVVGGAWALGVSWLARDLRGIWCAPPRRFGWRRGDGDGGRPRDG